MAKAKLICPAKKGKKSFHSKAAQKSGLLSMKFCLLLLAGLLSVNGKPIFQHPKQKPDAIIDFLTNSNIQGANMGAVLGLKENLDLHDTVRKFHHRNLAKKEKDTLKELGEKMNELLESQYKDYLIAPSAFEGDSDKKPKLRGDYKFRTNPPSTTDDSSGSGEGSGDDEIDDGITTIDLELITIDITRRPSQRPFEDLLETTAEGATRPPKMTTAQAATGKSESITSSPIKTTASGGIDTTDLSTIVADDKRNEDAVVNPTKPVYSSPSSTYDGQSTVASTGTSSDAYDKTMADVSAPAEPSITAKVTKQAATTKLTVARIMTTEAAITEATGLYSGYYDDTKEGSTGIPSTEDYTGFGWEK